MSRKKRELTTIEKQKAIVLLEEGLPRKEIGEILKVNYASLKEFYEFQGIPSRLPIIHLDDQERIIELYAQGYTFKRLHEDYFPHYTEGQLNRFVRLNGKSRKRGQVVPKVAFYGTNLFLTSLERELRCKLGFTERKITQ